MNNINSNKYSSSDNWKTYPWKGGKTLVLCVYDGKFIYRSFTSGLNFKSEEKVSISNMYSENVWDTELQWKEW